MQQVKIWQLGPITQVTTLKFKHTIKTRKEEALILEDIQEQKRTRWV
jgi:hypothetical protein